MTHTINTGAFIGAALLTLICGLALVFGIGLIGTVITGESVWMFVPTITAIIGGPIYVMFGLPAAWVTLKNRPITALQGALLGFGVNAALFCLALILGTLIWGRPDDATGIIFGSGSIAAPVLGALFAGIYNTLSLKSRR